MSNFAFVPYVFTFKNDMGVTASYKRHEELGSGGFATVYRVTDVKTQKDYAMKVMTKEKYTKPKTLEKLKSEISIQASIHHPNVLGSLGHYEDTRYYYILLELAPGKSVRDLVRSQRRLPEKQVVSIVKDVLAGVGYLHDNRIIHRDLKLENFLFGADGKVKVADFGLSTKLDYPDEKKYTLCGTPNYLCPEILRSKGHSYEVDIWAIGVCVYVMLFGRQPFDCIKTKLLYEHIKQGSYTIPSEPKVSSSAVDFIKKTLQINPNLRPSIQELLVHPFVTGSRFEAIVPKKVAPRIAAQEPMRIAPRVNLNPALKPSEPMRRITEKNENVLDNNLPIRGSEELSVPKYFVSRFCDESKTLGFGYLLADGTVGLIMKDHSRWIMDPHETFVQYYRDYNCIIPEVIDLPTTRYSEINVIMKFSRSLKKVSSMFSLPATPYTKSLPLRHVKYFLRNSSATLFRMDQKDVQVNFDDKTKVIYFTRTRKMLMVNNLKEKTHPILVDSLKASHALTEEKSRYDRVHAMLVELSKQHV